LANEKGEPVLALVPELFLLVVIIRVVANAVGVARAGEIDSFNKFMMPLNLLLLIDNPVNDDQKKEFWDQCKNWFPLLVGEGALMNPVFGSVWDRFAREQGDSDGIAVREGMQRSVLEPSKFFFHDLPLRALDADSVGQSSSVDPFAATSLALTRGLDEEPATRTLWGRNITWDRNWDIDDADIERLGGIDRSRSVTDQILELWPELSKVNRSDYSDRRSFGEMLREIGPDREAEDFRRRKISRDLFPVSDPTEETFWLENSGVDYVFARMLAGYLNRDYLPTLPPEEQENLDGLPLSGAGAGEYVDAINASLSDQVRRNRIGAASFLPGDDGRQEIVAPAEDGKLVHMSRRTELRFKPWRRSVFGPDQRYDNVCLVYAEDRGSLECFARNGDELHYFFQDESDWTAGGVLTSDTRGMPGGVYQPTGTIDLVVPREGSGLIHLRGALGEEASRSWEVVSTFARDRRGIDAVSVIQSVFGNLELVYRDGDKLRHMYRSLEGDWRGGNIDITDDARGAPSLLQGREGERGDFELLCPHQNRGLLYLRRNNDVPGQPWSSEGVWLRGRGQLDGVSMFRRSDGLLGATVFKDRDMFNIYKHPTLGWVEVLEFDGVDGVFVQALVTTDIAPPPGSPVDEYIALSNPSAEEELDLSGWSIRDAKGHRYTIGAGFKYVGADG
ncbi:MAG: lamin tail domain-containing protein, partial [Myxococcota bacterium]